MSRYQTDNAEPHQPVPTKHDWPEQEAFRTRKTILVAEDDPDLRYVMMCSLHAMGYSVVTAGDAFLASTAFKTHGGIDLLLTDFDMPGRTGMELARELTGLRPTLPVLIITGSILQAETLTEINTRHWTYVSKPCHLLALDLALQRELKVASHPATGLFPV